MAKPCPPPGRKDHRGRMAKHCLFGSKLRLYDVKEVSEILNVSERTVRRMIERKEIPHIRIRGRVLFREETIDRWLRDLEEKNNTELAR